MDDKQLALTILERAMDIEQEGQGFYLKASQTTRDEKGREIFATLAGDEQKHYNLIRRQYDALTKEEKWREFPEIKPITSSLERPLFPIGKEALKKAITDKSSDRDALLFGLEIETKSYNLYCGAASETEAPLGKRMFEFLAGEERGHFNILMMRYDALFGPIAWAA